MNHSDIDTSINSVMAEPLEMKQQQKYLRRKNDQRKEEK
jgi:hypothetical protein